MNKMINQQQSSEEENVQRLSLRGVHTISVETENTLTSNVEGEDIVQNLRSLCKMKNRNIEAEKAIFLHRVQLKFDNKFDFDLTNYNGITGNKISIICPIHGVFFQIPHVFLLNNNKCGCPKCGLKMKNKSKTKDYNDFIERASIVHNNFYTYFSNNENTYVNRKSKVVITCNKHGDFVKSAQKHLSGQGCFKCKIEYLIENNILVGGYCEEIFNKNPELSNKDANLYYISINNGEFYKIGITTIPMNKRFIGIKYKSKGKVKSYELLYYKKDTLYNCFKKEQSILTEFKDLRIIRDWSGELFKENILSKINF